MKRTAGFSLIELLIVVAIILIIAAIAIPSLVRARIAANESAMVADLRSIISAEVAFQSTTNGFGTLACLQNPAGCFAGAGTMPLIDPLLASGADKGGYRRVFADNGQALIGAGITGGIFSGFCYGGMPRMGVRSFSGDDSGAIVQSGLGANCCVGGANDTTACQTMAH
jgi:type IV pilus assembly protein PilA